MKNRRSTPAPVHDLSKAHQCARGVSPCSDAGLEFQSYEQFIANKVIKDVPTGFEPGPMSDDLFDFQHDVSGWACRRGRAALFEDCGLGKTRQQLVWADQVVTKTGKPVLGLAPLCVTGQTKREGAHIGIDVNIARNQSEIRPGINYTNYEKLHRFDPSAFSGVVLDESSILKSFDGATRNLVIESFADCQYKLACTATPAPNDFMEIGNHAEFLGVMTRAEMLATFFVHDGGEVSKWRLKGHAEQDFWLWLCSWAVNIRRPSDLGYKDGKFKLPKLNMVEHVVESKQKMDGYLFALPASSLQERRAARGASLNERVAVAADLTSGSRDQWVFWCNLNSESQALAKLIGAEEISGATPEEERERIAQSFIDGKTRCVVTKPSIWGFGMNLQCCHNTALVGLSDSYESFYQVVRRFWRFGQSKEVNAHLIISDLEGAVLRNVKRKEADAARMADEMVRHMADISSIEIKGQVRDVERYEPQMKMKLPKFL